MKLLTAPGVAGVAVVVAAPGERDAVLAAVGLAPDQPWCVASAPPPRRAALRLGERVVDDLLLVSRVDGTLELHLHGSPAVLAALERHFGLSPDRAPTAAERLLRGAMGVSQLALALEQCTPGFAASTAAAASLPAQQARVALAAAVDRSRAALAMVTPARIALIGRQNAGKSTLFNCLLQRERVLTGARPGLTRDAVLEVSLLEGYPCELIDTAGEGDVADDVDRAAIDVARAWRACASSVLVIDATRGPGASDLAAMADATLVVATRRDLVGGGIGDDWPRRPDVLVDARSAEPGEVRREFGRLLRLARGLPPAGPVGGFAALDDDEFASLQAVQRSL